VVGGAARRGREEIANSIEKAYPTLKLQTAVQMLSLPSVAKLEAYAAEVGAVPVACVGASRSDAWPSSANTRTPW